jgi:hypothetical protein
MSQLNNAFPDGLSDHAPIVIDLPLFEPAPLATQTGNVKSISE